MDRAAMLARLGAWQAAAERLVGPGAALSVAVAVVAGLVGLVVLWACAARRRPPPPPFLASRERQSVRLVGKETLSHDVRRFRFALPLPAQELGLATCKHVKLFAPNSRRGVKVGEWNGRPDSEAAQSEVERKYTPSSPDSARGYFELVLKVYKGGLKEQFPDGGKMSQFLDALPLGAEVQCQGPFGLHQYEGRGLFRHGKREHRYSKVGMIAGGTGITPMLQLISRVLADPADTTSLSLIFANQTEEDIFLRDMLEALQREHPQRFRLHHTLDRPPPAWKYSSGFISEAMVRDHLPSPAHDTVVLMCGPPPMIKFACKPNLAKLGHAEDNQIEF
jgi:cytochrome-b5 reductase